LDGKHWILRTKLTLTEHSSIATTCMPKIDFSDWGLMYNFDIRNKSYGCFTIHSAILSQLHLILSILIIFMLIFAVEIFHHQYFFFFFFFFFFKVNHKKLNIWQLSVYRNSYVNNLWDKKNWSWPGVKYSWMIEQSYWRKILLK
jgi:hypothetical protein